jgi:hypothetical protein
MARRQGDIREGDPVTRSELRDAYCKSSSKAQLSLLSGLAHEMTIVGRSFYSDGPAPSDGMIALNELQHQITGQLRHLVAEDGERYPDDVFVNILFELVAKTELEKDFPRSFERVLSR